MGDAKPNKASVRPNEAGARDCRVHAGSQFLCKTLIRLSQQYVLER